MEFKEFKLQLWSSLQITRVPCMQSMLINMMAVSNYSREFVHGNFLLRLVSYVSMIANMVKDTIKIWLPTVPVVNFGCGFGTIATKLIS